MKTYKISVKFIVMTVFMIAIAVLAVSVGASMIREDGIEQTFVCVNLLAFMFVAPISFIPWDAVGKISERQGFYSAPVDTDKVKAGFMGKFLLKLAGFGFGSGMVKPAVDREDIRHYSGK